MTETALKPVAFIRTIKIKLRPSLHQRHLLSKTHEATHQRSAQWAKLLLACRGLPVDIRTPTGIEHYDEKQWDKTLDQYCSSPPSKEHRELLRELFREISRSSMLRAYVSPLKNIGAKANSKGRGFEIVRELQEGNVLPFKMKDFPSDLDYASFDMATSHLSSWDSNNARTETAYASAISNLHDSTPDANDLTALQDFESAFGVTAEDGSVYNPLATEKMAGKIKKYGWDIRNAKEMMTWCSNRLNDPNAWAKLFLFRSQERRLSRMRPRAIFSFSNEKTSLRQVPCGENYIKFKLSNPQIDQVDVSVRLFDGEKMIWSQLSTIRTRQMKGLTIEGNHPYTFRYRKGNLESAGVTGIVRECSLFRSINGKEISDFVHFPINISIEPDILATQVRDQYYREPNSTGINVPAGFRIMSADMGLNPAWAWTTWQDGKPCAEGMIGSVGSSSQMARIKRLQRRVKAVKRLINYFKDATNGHITEWTKASAEKGCLVLGITIEQITREKLSKIVFETNKSYRGLRHYLRMNRKPGVHAEAYQWIFLSKDVTSMLKKWAYKFSDSKKLGDSRPGFEKHSQYLANYKMNLLKKFAHSLVNQASKHGARLIVLEELGIERSKATRSTRSNELAAIWSPAAIQNWIKHFAIQSNIEIVFVDPAHTSQRDPLTERFGWRSKFNKTHLWVERNNKIKCIDADMAAATNIYRRFVDRVGTTSQMWFQTVVNPEVLGLKSAFIPIIEKKSAPKDDSSKKWKKSLREHLMLRLYGSTQVALDLESNKTLIDHSAMKKAKVQTTKVLLYRDGEKWITQKEREKRRSLIREKARTASGMVMK